MPKTICPASSGRRSARRRSTPAASAVAAGPIDPSYAFRGIVADRIVTKPIEMLHVSRHQARTHDEAQIALIMGSFTQFGLINPLIVCEDGEILAGAARFEAARRLGIGAVPVVPVTHLTAAEKRAYRLADNRIAERAGWDTEALRIEFEHLIEISFDLGTIGFSAPEIDIVLSDPADDAAEADDMPAIDPAAAAVTRPGDLFRLGRHRLLCGDALQPASYAALMGGEEARMGLSDPPYNCPVDGFVGGLGKVKHREFAMAAGEMSEGEFTAFLTRYYRNMAARVMDGGLVYTFMDWRQQYPLLHAARGLGLQQINLCVWNKTVGAMGSFYRSQHELCAIHKVGDAPHLNLVELGRHGRYRTNVWDHPGMGGFGRDRDELLRAHPTVKPWAMLAEAIRDCTRQGELVLDPFLGSGSTLIAAERTGRACRGIELDPIYCDTAVRRWEQASGEAAMHAATGLRFAELAAERAVAAARDEAAPASAAGTDTIAVRHRARPGAAKAGQRPAGETVHA